MIKTGEIKKIGNAAPATKTVAVAINPVRGVGETENNAVGAARGMVPPRGAPAKLVRYSTDMENKDEKIAMDISYSIFFIYRIKYYITGFLTFIEKIFDFPFFEIIDEFKNCINKQRGIVWFA